MDTMVRKLQWLIYRYFNILKSVKDFITFINNQMKQQQYIYRHSLFKRKYKIARKEYCL